MLLIWDGMTKAKVTKREESERHTKEEVFVKGGQI
jgi:hypothetical protein